MQYKAMQRNLEFPFTRASNTIEWNPFVLKVFATFLVVPSIPHGFNPWPIQCVGCSIWSRGPPLVSSGPLEAWGR